MSTPSIGFGPYKGPERFLSGAGAGGTDGATEVIDPGTGKPTTAPVPTDATLTIASLSLTTETYLDETGIQRASVRAVWTMPTQGEHDTDPRMIGRYEVSYTTGAAPGFGPGTSTDLRDVTIRSLPVEREVTVRVRAVTNAGVKGPYKGATIFTKRDDAPPPVPSKPLVYGTFKGATVRWDGGTASGEPIPPDWRYVIGEISLDPNFAPSATVQAGFLYEAGMMATTPIGTSPFTVYARLVAVDLSGNRSVPSEVAQADSLRLLPPDVGEAAITKAALAKGAVDANAIAQGAVTAFGLAPDSVGEANLTNLAVTAAKIVDGAITAIKIRAGAIDDTKIVDGAILSSKLAPLSVLSDKLAANAVTVGKIGANAVDNLALATGAVNTENVRADAITDKLLAQFAVKARAVGFEVAGSNQLLNSSFEDIADPASPAPADVVPHWEAEQLLRLRRVTTTGFHGTVALRTTFDKTVAVRPPLTTL